ncbi:MAG: DegT/DnrJ/EryC1/StrS family aminotransferase [Flavobacteriales bacterium]|nr:DegT/DnrJ/EryC1/StrS family aminotransferase [Flavobacteriales bacterium]
MIPFSPPRIDDAIIDAVVEVLRSGWITTGPKTRLLEERIAAYTASDDVVCLNAWTTAAELVLRWFGVGPGDEVIVPAYTYAATANIVVHTGARPVMVDCCGDHFNLDVADLRKKITASTKVIMPVDIGGWPCDYDALMALVNENDVRAMFSPSTERQSQLGRILVMSDAAHSFGARYRGMAIGNQTDVSGFSFHAVKNLTTAEGGAVCLNLPAPFDNKAIGKSLRISALHGQTKDALSKMQAGQWQYDIIEPGYKCNLTDVLAVIGLTELGRYDSQTLPRRKAICEQYDAEFANCNWYIAPPMKDALRETSYHLFMLRIASCTEKQRNEIISGIAEHGVSVNVHFQPLPLLSYYRESGYDIAWFPNAMQHYQSEISLPVYYDLSDQQVETVIRVVKKEVERVINAA